MRERQARTGERYTTALRLLQAERAGPAGSEVTASGAASAEGVSEVASLPGTASAGPVAGSVSDARQVAGSVSDAGPVAGSVSDGR